MRAFTKGALAITAAAAVTTGVCAPAANAISVKVDGQVCTFTVPDHEMAIADPGKGPWTVDRSKAAESITSFQIELAHNQSELKKYEAARNLGTISEGEYQEMKIYAEKVEANRTLMLPALRACAEGKDLSQTSSEAQVTLSSADGKGLTPAGIGVTVAGAVAAVLGLLVAALPQIKPLLPAQIANLLP